MMMNNMTADQQHRCSDSNCSSSMNNLFVAGASPSSSSTTTNNNTNNNNLSDHAHPQLAQQHPFNGFTYYKSVHSAGCCSYNVPSPLMYNNPFANYFPPFPHQHYSSPTNSNNIIEKSNVLLSDGGSNSESECKVILPENGHSDSKTSISVMPIKKRALSNVNMKKPALEDMTKQTLSPSVEKNDKSDSKKQPRTKDSPLKSDESEKKRKRIKDENEELKKKERRLVRNRQSAQASRERKKQYIQSLEAKVAELEKKVHELEEENNELKKKQKP